MFGLVYVILPVGSVAPAEAITASLARFQRGRRGDVPDEWLRWHDRTAEVQALHETAFRFTIGAGLRIEGGESWLLDSVAIRAAMESRGLGEWSIRFADIQPDVERFANAFLRPLERHPATQGFGYWLNSLGRWDWWDLGGRFDGAITDKRSRGRRSVPRLSSGFSRGRDAYETLADILGATSDGDCHRLDIEPDDNLEFVSRLGEELAAYREGRLPTDILLTPGAVEEDLRWIASWPDLGPLEGLAALSLPGSANWREIVESIYGRFSDHWAAGVAFHF